MSSKLKEAYSRHNRQLLLLYHYWKFALVPLKNTMKKSAVLGVITVQTY